VPANAAGSANPGAAFQLTTSVTTSTHKCAACSRLSIVSLTPRDASTLASATGFEMEAHLARCG
jgi:hypothetical protein